MFLEDCVRGYFFHRHTVEIILMQKLVEGIHQFQNAISSSKQRLFEGLVDGQHPLALFITCSDSRINPLVYLGLVYATG